ncbi:MAG: transglutaminase domain-containing protein [Filifactoraceae bacterium]
MKIFAKILSLSLSIIILFGYKNSFSLLENEIIKIDVTRNNIDSSTVVIDFNNMNLDYFNLYMDTNFSRLNRIIKQAISSNKDTFLIRSKEIVDKNFLKEVLELITAYNGYSFKSYEVNSVKDKNNIYNLIIKVNYRETEYERKKVNEWVSMEILKNVDPIEDPKEKIKKINEIITKSLNYDSSLLYNTAYQGVYEGKTVCDGYAVLVYRMMLAAGFSDTLTVSGLATNNGKDYIEHRWNMVKLEGKWYHVDVTFNDTGENINDYLLKNDSFMVKNHKWNKSRYPISY